MRVTIIPIIIEELGTAPKKLEKKLKEMESRVTELQKTVILLTLCQDSEKGSRNLRSLVDVEP